MRAISCDKACSLLPDISRARFNPLNVPRIPIRDDLTLHAFRIAGLCGREILAVEDVQQGLGGAAPWGLLVYRHQGGHQGTRSSSASGLLHSASMACSIVPPFGGSHTRFGQCERLVVPEQQLLVFL